MKKLNLLIMLILSGLLIQAQSIFVFPDTTQVENPGEFQVCIHVDESIVEFRGYRVVLAYNAEVMSFVEAARGEVMDGFGNYWWRVFDEGADSLHIECMGFGAGVSVDGPGNILTLTFTTVAPGTTPLELKSFTIYDVDGLPMEGVSSEDGIIKIANTVGIADHKAGQGILEVYPNPFQSRAVVKWTQQTPGSATLQLTDLRGAIVYHRETGSAPSGSREYEINCDGIMAGVYVLWVEQNGIRQAVKVIKE
jgi:hypothetical protein